MKAVQAAGFGDYKILTVENNVTVPRLDDPYEPTEKRHFLVEMATRQDRKTHMLIRTLAVALAPGDARTLSGKTAEFQGPPSFPYIPGGDCCGIVEETCPGCDAFKVGDLVAARFTNAPRDALGEFAPVSISCCARVPQGINPQQAAALASASPAVLLSDRVKPTDRVLIMGAGGGIGSHLCQLVKAKGAYVCALGREPQRLMAEPLNCDDAIDYTKENIFDAQKYQNEPFDLIIDLACGGWLKLYDNVVEQGKPSIVKPASQGGLFLTPTTDQPYMEGHSLWAMMSLFLVKPTGRMLWSRIITRNTLPVYNKVDCLPNDPAILIRTFDLVQEGKFEAVVDGPHPFTTTGVRGAFQQLSSRHARGKVVIQVSDNNKT